MPAIPDAFETLRDCRNLFIKHLGALLRDSRILSDEATKAVQHGAGTYFDAMVSSERRGSFEEEVDGLTSSRITLVGEDDLELDIRLDNLSARLFDAAGAQLWKAHLRFVTLLRRPNLSNASNPIGPRAIRQGLDDMFAAAGAIGLERKLELLDQLEGRLLENLPGLYAEIGDFLEQAGVEASQPTIGAAPDNAKARATETTGLPANALLALQQALLSQLPGQFPGQLPGLIAAPGGNAVASLLNQATVERLLFRLNELDRRHGTYSPPQFSSTASTNLETLIPGLFTGEETTAPIQPKSLHSDELGVPANAPEGLAIDTLAMIFEAMFSNPKLPDALKAVVSSLQITMLKVAMQDPGLFTDNAHPARLLLDRMGNAVLGLPIDAPVRHPVYQRLFGIAGQLRSSYTSDLAVFNEALATVDAVISERHDEISAFAQPYIALLNQLDRRDQAAIQTRLVLDPLVERGVPPAISEFLDKTWSKALQVTWLENGPDSTAWQEQTAVVEELLWTFQPKADAEERKALARRLPEILKRLKTGMERLGIAADAQATFLDTCFALQTKALRPVAAVDLAREERPLEAHGLHRREGTPLAGEVAAGELVLRTLDFSEHQPAPARALGCAPGDWLEITLNGGKRQVAHVSHISQTSRRALLCNPEAELALAIHPAILDRQLRDGLAHVCSALSLFESAADRALSRTTAS